jgi:hypothetical protein
MSGRIDAEWRPEEFTPVGVVKVSNAALELGRAVGAAGRRRLPGKDWVVQFHWYLSQRYRYPDTDWVEEGPGLDVGASERSEIPPDRIAVIDGLEFAVAIPKDICEAATERLIDVAGDGTTKLILR